MPAEGRPGPRPIVSPLRTPLPVVPLKVVAVLGVIPVGVAPTTPLPVVPLPAVPPLIVSGTPPARMPGVVPTAACAPAPMPGPPVVGAVTYVVVYVVGALSVVPVAVVPP